MLKGKTELPKNDLENYINLYGKSMLNSTNSEVYTKWVMKLKLVLKIQ